MLSFDEHIHSTVSKKNLESQFNLDIPDLNERMTTKASQNCFYSALMNYENIKNFYEEQTQRDFSRLENIECKQDFDEKDLTEQTQNRFQLNYNPRYNRPINTENLHYSPIRNQDSFPDSLEDDFFQYNDSSDECSPQDLKPKIYNVQPQQMDYHPRVKTETNDISFTQDLNRIKNNAKRDIALLNQSIQAEQNEIDKLTSLKVDQHLKRKKINIKRDIGFLNQTIQTEQNEIDKLTSQKFDLKENQDPNLRVKAKKTVMDPKMNTKNRPQHIKHVKN